MNIDNFSPQMNTEVAKLLRNDCEIQYPFGLTLIGDKDNQKIHSRLQTLEGDSFQGSFDWTDQGITNAFLNSVMTLCDNHHIDGFQVFDKANNTIGFETFEILDFDMALNVIEQHGGTLVIVQHGDIEDPSYV